LKASSRAWFGVTIASQLLFAAYIMLFFGLSAMHGHLGDRARLGNHGYVAGDVPGNIAAGVHIVFAALLNLSGALQLVPALRARAPGVHRWNGRAFIGGAVLVSLAGSYMIWIRGSVGDLSQHLASTLDALLIFLCAALALRNALARNFAAHRRWALRLFMVLSAVWFFRLGLFLWIVVNHGPAGFDSTSFTGPALTISAFGSFLLPLAVLEIYLGAERGRGGTLGRFAAAALVFVATIAMVGGTLAVAAAAWLPSVTTAYQNRESIVEPLYAIIESRGIDAAVARYRSMKTAKNTTENFDEAELNTLGYKLIGAHKFAEAVRVLELNAEVYPQSANVYDSLGEACMDAGDRSKAIEYYRRSLELNPNNGNAVARLQTLDAGRNP
jgi:tetratricopeptide (TPR) repeat protein